MIIKMKSLVFSENFYECRDVNSRNVKMNIAVYHIGMFTS